jgi:LmbE family N-acetylglucosaminyl deacetylase
MLPLLLDSSLVRQVLCLGAHCDDIEIGAGGSLIELSQRLPNAHFRWVVFSSDDEREAETRAAAARVHGSASHTVEVMRIRGSYFPSEFAALKDAIESVKQGPTPDLVLTHRLEDRHQDHRTVAELTWNTFRRHSILEYEIPKYEGDLGQPNFYMPLSAATAEAKVRMLMDCFPSQRQRAWFTPDLFQAQLRLRGMECNAPSGMAEAFHGRKLIFSTC